MLMLWSICSKKKKQPSHALLQKEIPNFILFPLSPNYIYQGQRLVFLKQGYAYCIFLHEIVTYRKNKAEHFPFKHQSAGMAPNAVVQYKFSIECMIRLGVIFSSTLGVPSLLLRLWRSCVWSRSNRFSWCDHIWGPQSSALNTAAS